MNITRKQLVQYQEAIVARANELWTAIEEVGRRYDTLKKEYNLVSGLRGDLDLILLKWPQNRAVIIPAQEVDYIAAELWMERVKERELEAEGREK